MLVRETGAGYKAFVRIIARRHLDAYGARHPIARAALQRWIELMRDGEWSTPLDVQGAFAAAKAVTGDRLRFEIAGGHHRLVAAFDFRRQIVFIKFLGTHAEYDRIDATSVSMF